MDDESIPLRTIKEGEVSPTIRKNGQFTDVFDDTASKEDNAATAKRTRKTSFETRLIRAIRRGCLFNSANIDTKDLDVNELLQTDNEQRSAFHHAIKNPDILKALLEYCKMHPALYKLLLQEDKYGQTPIHHAAVVGDAKCLEILHEYDHALIKLRSNLNDYSVLHFAVMSCDIVTVKFVLNKDPEQINMADSKSRTAAHYATKKDILDHLISWDVDTMRKDISGYLPIHTAARKGLLNIVELLIVKEPDCINQVDDERQQTPLMLAAMNGFPEVVNFLLKNTELKNVIQTDLYLHSAFDLAIKDGKSDVIEVFLNHNDWEKIITESRIGPRDCLTELIKKMPDTALVLLNNCIKTKGTEEDPEILYDFFCFQKGNSQSICGTLGAMVELERDKCLSHPLSVKYVNMKWRQRGFKYNLTAIILAFVFHTCFMVYTVSLNEIFYVPGNGTSTSGKNISAIQGIVAGIRPENNKMYCLRIIMLVLIFLLMVKELFQVTMQQSQYFYHTKHYVQWTMFITVLIYLLPLDNVITRTQLGFGAVSIFLSWFTLIQFLGMIPVLGVYLLAVEKVFWTLTKVLTVVFIYILGFASTFFVLLEELGEYNDFGDAIVYTFVAMMAGSEELLLARSKTFPELRDLKLFVLVVFIIIMSIVVNNTLIGLAVGDTSEVMESAKVTKFHHKACTVYYLEKSVSHLPGFYIKEDPSVTEFPMQKKNSLQTILDFVYHGGQPVNMMDMIDGLPKQEDVVECELTREDNFELLTSKIENLRMELMERFQKIEDKHTAAMEKILEKLS